MPFPPLEENNTSRLWVYYATGGGSTSQEHSFSVRYNNDAMPAAVLLEAIGDAFLETGNAAQLFDGWHVLRAEYQLAGAIARFPIPVPAPFLALVGSGQAAATPAEQAREARFIGRGSLSGRRVSFSLYGVNNASLNDPDFRVVGLGTGLLNDLLTLAQGLGGSALAFVSIDGGNTTWYNYVNWQYNSHWESEQRS